MKNFRWSDEGCQLRSSGGSEGDVTHTYVNLRRMSLGAQIGQQKKAPLARDETEINRDDDANEQIDPHESTQFEEFTLTTIAPSPIPQPPPPRRYINLISNL